MDLWLIRHGIAADGADGADAARPLTPAGIEKFAKVVKGLRKRGVSFDRILHSPWTRAVETADLLMELCRGESVVTPRLARSPDAELLAEIAGESLGPRAERGVGCDALVGHQPWLGELAAWLTIDAPGAASVFVLKKGGAIWLAGEPRPWGMQVRALLPPKMLGA